MNAIKSRLPLWLILVSVCAITLLGAMPHAGGLPGLGKIILGDLNLSATQLGGLFAVNHLGIMLFSGWAGYQSDRRPVLHLLLIGLLLQFFSIIGFAASTNYSLLLFFRILDGVGFSFVNVAGTSELLRRYPLAQRAMILGIKGTIFPASIMLGSTAIPFLAFVFNWRIALFLASLGPIMALLIAGAVFPFKKSVSAVTRKPSMSPLQAMKIPVVWLLGTVGTVCMLVQNGVISFLPLYLQTEMALSFSTALQFLSLIILSGMAGRILIGYLACKVLGVRGWLLSAMFSTCGCLLALSQLGAGTHLGLIIPILIVLGISLFGWYGSYVALINELSPAGSTGSFAGISTQFTALGAILGPSLLGIFIDSLGFSMAFILIAFLLLGMSFMLFVPHFKMRELINQGF